MRWIPWPGLHADSPLGLDRYWDWIGTGFLGGETNRWYPRDMSWLRTLRRTRFRDSGNLLAVAETV
jgi:hypothetical protein